MWILCMIISILFCGYNWFLSMKQNRKNLWAMGCSFYFAGLTILMQYRMVLQWVEKEDWTALLDVVPSSFKMLAGYMTIMAITNILPIVMKNRK